jgi:crotonobetainyl-CoA:carnitine CoA-transferase CaiB-like acyl-CoA transferase
MVTPQASHHFLSAMWAGLGGLRDLLSSVEFRGSGVLPSVFAVEDFASAAIGAAGLAINELLQADSGRADVVTVDRKLASLWYSGSIQPVGWALPSPWDAVAGDYATADGWIRLHTNAPHHRAAALGVLGVSPERDAVARAVANWKGEALEQAIVQSNGCAAVMRSLAEWREHQQGAAVSAEPLIHIQQGADHQPSTWRADASRPLRGVRVLDLTRVLAGPVATRFLAGFGAEVLRIDPPEWDEPAVVPDVTLGKRCARLDMRTRRGRSVFEQLLQECDVLIHGYRANALEALDLGADRRRELRPGLIDVSLNAYGWSGPWRNRRGFDSLVQMSAGIADEGMRRLRRPRPTPLPVQALDHATGYLIAAAAIRGLTERVKTSRGYTARLSLARSATLLIDGPRDEGAGEIVRADDGDWQTEQEHSEFGTARRLRGPVTAAGSVMQWDRPAARLGSSPAHW